MSPPLWPSSSSSPSPSMSSSASDAPASPGCSARDSIDAETVESNRVQDEGACHDFSNPACDGTRTQPLVSVVIPCYQQGAFLQEAIESIVRQTYPRYEIIVVDDASPDETARVAQQYRSVRYVRHDRNRGLGASRNTGIRHSTGEFLVFLDADDRLLPHHLEACLQVFRERPELALVCGDFRWFGEGEMWHHHRCGTERDQYAALLRFGFITPPHTVMVKRQAMLSVGGFKEDRKFEGSEDRDCWLQIARRYPLQCHHQCIAEYRRHATQMSRRWGLMLASGMAAMREQWPYVRGNPVYEDAYYSGVRQYQDACGPPLLWQTVRDFKEGRWLRAAGSCWILARSYPRGLIQLVKEKMLRVLRSRTAASV